MAEQEDDHREHEQIPFDRSENRREGRVGSDGPAMAGPLLGPAFDFCT